MIRRRDQIRLSVQKLALRRKRAAFSVISVALGMIVVVTLNSLINNVRDLIQRTSVTEDIDKDVIRIYATDNPYEFTQAGKEKKEAPKKRYQFLTEAAFEEMRAWPEVVAADHPVTLAGISFDALQNRPRAVSMAVGVPDTMLRRYVRDAGLLAGASNAVPVVIGERDVRLNYDADHKRFVTASTNEVNAWLGRDIPITVGDAFANLPRFNYDYEKKQWNAVSEDDLAQQREALLRNNRERFDATIFNTALSLRARVVGFCPGSQVLLPQDTAALIEKWLTQRRELAALWPGAREEEEVAYGVRGRSTPKADEYTEGIVLAKEGANVEALAKRIKELGFETATRASAFEAMMKDFDTVIRFVKRIAFAFGAIILGLAGGLLWSTTSRIVSDSRTDIGLFRALGATKGDIRRLFLSEAVLLGLLGTLFGMLLGWALAWQISRWTITFVRRDVVDPEQMLVLPDSVFSIDVRFCLMLLAGAAVFSILAGLWPANRAASVDPVQALKRE
jgi:ABC-type lipoprotein release transport system permease subunit